MKVLSHASRKRGYLTDWLITDGLVVAVGGQAYDITILASSDGQAFHSRPTPDQGLRAIVAHRGAWWVCGEYGLVAKSTDQAQSWQVLHTHDSGCLFALCVHDDTLYVAGDKGLLATVDDDGLTRVKSGMRSRILGLFSDEDGLWLLGYNGTLRRHGQSPALKGTAPLTGMARSADALYVSGDRGQLYRSSDGDTWDRVDLGVHEDLEDVAVVGGRAVVVGGGGTVLVQDEAGFQPIASGTRETLWSIGVLGQTAFIGGSKGLVLSLDGANPLHGGADVFAQETPLDRFFEDGPQDWVARHLQDYVAELNPQPTTKQARGGEPGDAPQEKGADAWKADAWRRWRGLWTGGIEDFAHVWGTAPSAELTAFYNAIEHADPWGTFYELRLDCALAANPPEGQNLFEKMVLNDQLNYLGTALPEVLAGVACFGSLGNGDTWHLEVYDREGARQVHLWDHETHRFELVAADSLDSLLYLSALCVADDADQVSAGHYQRLDDRVAPPWHFSMDDRDPRFQRLEVETSMVEYFYWRAAWLRAWFRAHQGIAQVQEYFLPNLNGVLPPEHLDGRHEALEAYVPTALYTLWRAWLWDEPELPRWLAACRAHTSRVVRDAAALIDEFDAGRNTLGRIRDVQAWRQALRELDLDPARAAAREAEAAERARQAEARRQTLRQRLATEGAEAIFWAHPEEAELRAELANELLADHPAQRGLTFLREQGFSRDNRLYRDEEAEGVAFVAQHADGLLQALLVGAALHRGEEEPIPHAWDTLVELARLGRLDARALPPLRAWLAANDEPGYRMNRVLDVVGYAADRDSVPHLVALLKDVPHEGGFETMLKFDDHVGAVADTLARIGAGGEALVRFAGTEAQRMRKARVRSARALGRIAPHLATPPMCLNLVAMTGAINDSQENAAALLAVAQLARTLDDGSAVLEALQAQEPMANRYVEVQLARAVARQALGEEQPVDALVERCLTEPGWKEEYTLRRRAFAAEVLEFLGRDTPTTTPGSVTWFQAQDLSEEERSAALADPERLGRYHLARLSQDRGALEAALEGVAQAAPENGRDLDRQSDRLLYEGVKRLAELPQADSTVALFDRLLRHPNTTVKDPVLRIKPRWEGLRDGMRAVAAEKWGWQERAARDWLAE